MRTSDNGVLGSGSLILDLVFLAWVISLDASTNLEFLMQTNSISSHTKNDPRMAIITSKPAPPIPHDCDITMTA